MHIFYDVPFFEIDPAWRTRVEHAAVMFQRREHEAGCCDGHTRFMIANKDEIILVCSCAIGGGDQCRKEG